MHPLRFARAAILVAALVSTACSQHADPATRVADTTNDIMASTKVLVRTVMNAEATMTPEQKKAAGSVLDTFYLTAYQVGVRGEQIADLLVAYKAAAGAVSSGSLLDRVEALLPVLDRDLQQLVGVALPVGSSTEIVKLVQNVTALTNTLRSEAARLRQSRTQAARLPPHRPPNAASLRPHTTTA